VYASLYLYDEAVHLFIHRTYYSYFGQLHRVIGCLSSSGSSKMSSVFVG